MKQTGAAILVSRGMKNLQAAPAAYLIVRPQVGAPQMSIIHRFRLDVLKKKAGRLYLQRRLFTGIAYEVQGNRVVANYQVTDGVRGGSAEVWDLARIRVVWDALITVDATDTNAQFPKEGVYVEGALFEGVAYAFDNKTGMLLQELDFHPTQRGPSREWRRSGALAADFDRIRPDGTRESIRYHEDGGIYSFHSQKMGWGRTREGRLRSLLLRPGYAKHDLQGAPLRVDPMLYLAGRAITDKVLERLEDLPCLEHLTLDDTKISATGLKRFRNCTHLKYLGVYGKNGFRVGDARKLLARNPGCKWDRRPSPARTRRTTSCSRRGRHNGFSWHEVFTASPAAELVVRRWSLRVSDPERGAAGRPHDVSLAQLGTVEAAFEPSAGQTLAGVALGTAIAASLFALAAVGEGLGAPNRVGLAAFGFAGIALAYWYWRARKWRLRIGSHGLLQCQAGGSEFLAWHEMGEVVETRQKGWSADLTIRWTVVGPGRTMTVNPANFASRRRLFRELSAAAERHGVSVRVEWDQTSG